jgi:hypothetical protein
MMEQSRLLEIAARAEAASPGPWVADSGPMREVVEAARDSLTQSWEAICMPHNRVPSAWVASGAADAEFIAHAREDIPALLAALHAAHIQSNGEGE